MRSRIIESAVLLLVMASGCWRGEPLGQVTGQVTFQGQPVAKAVVIFSNPEKGVFIIAPLDGQGRYRVETANGYGLPYGDYAVSISPPPPDTEVGPAAPPKPEMRDDIPSRYRDPSTSGVRVTVGPGQQICNIAMSPES